MSKVFVGDIGTEVALDCGVNVSTATVRKILVKKPGSTATVEWSAVADGTNGIKHIAVSGDFSVAGVYSLQAYIEMPGWTGRGEVAKVDVSA